TGCFQTEFFLTLEIVTQVIKVRLFRSEEEVSLGTVVGGIANDFLKSCVERNGVERHLYVDGGGELRAHAAHALAGRAFALRALALNDQDIFASRVSEVPGNARTNDTAADNRYVNRVYLHESLKFGLGLADRVQKP